MVNCQYSPKLYLGFGKTSINLMAERKQIAGCQNLGALVGNRQDTWVNTLFELNNTWEFHCYLHFSRASVLLIFFFSVGLEEVSFLLLVLLPCIVSC